MERITNQEGSLYFFLQHCKYTGMPGVYTTIYTLYLCIVVVDLYDN